MPSSIHKPILGQARWQSNIDLHAVRDEVCARADVRSLAMQAGFRDVPRRPKALHCVHGPDKNPSARIYRGRVKCDACQGSWSPIDLIMLRDGGQFITALKTLAAETGVAMPNLTAAEAAGLRARRERARALAVDIADWADGMHAFAEQRKSDLVELLHWALEGGFVAVAEFAELQLEAIPRWVLSPEAADPRIIASAFRAASLAAPDSAARMLARGRLEREEFEGLWNGLLVCVRGPLPERVAA